MTGARSGSWRYTFGPISKYLGGLFCQGTVRKRARRRQRAWARRSLSFAPEPLETRWLLAAPVDDDAIPTVTLSINDGTISENGGVATLTAALTAVSSVPVVVDLGYSGTALPGIDFVASSQVLIPAGSLIRSVAIASVQDEIDEFAETILVQVRSVTNGTLSGPQQFVTTIADDDPAPTVTLGVDEPLIVESGGLA